jgi:hypothetical protein
VRRLPGPAVSRLSEGNRTPEALFELFRDWQKGAPDASPALVAAIVATALSAFNRCTVRWPHLCRCLLIESRPGRWGKFRVQESLSSGRSRENQCDMESWAVGRS